MARIKTVSLSPIQPGSKRLVEEEVLAGEIAGLEVLHVAIPAGRSFRISSAKGKGRVVIVLSGTGSLESGPWRQDLREVALAVPRRSQWLQLSAQTSVHIIELLVTFSEADEDEKDFRRFSAAYPFFLPYSQCTTYSEKIKSPKTVNRTLLPENTFPRLCIGSVETTGPDRVGEHRHPMLEQLFLGLAENHCVVKADEEETPFAPYELIHIPLGSNHGVRVDEGNKLHYIWIDLFRTREDVSWIAQQHVANPPPAPAAPGQKKGDS
jgi:hypothetical protein